MRTHHSLRHLTFSVSARSLSSLPRIVSVNRAVADSILLFDRGIALTLYIEDSKYHFISREPPCSHLRIYSARDMAAQVRHRGRYGSASIGVTVVRVSSLISRNLHRVRRLRFHRRSRRARASSGVIVSRIVSQSSLAL